MAKENIIFVRKEVKYMPSNEERVLEFYSGGFEDHRAVKSKSNSIEFRYTEKILREYIHKNSKVIELGCATGYYGMLFADDCGEYTGIDITPAHIEEFRTKIKTAGKENVHAYLGDATNLTEIADNSYDVVLCLGPMYHLPQEEREKVFQECYRIGRDGAVFAFAYINLLGAYAGACVNDNWREIYPNQKTNQYVFEYNTDDENPGVFFFTSPEEMESDAEGIGFSVIKNQGLDFFFAACAIDSMSEEQFECYLELADRMSSSPSCTGLANHALLVCCLAAKHGKSDNL